MNFNESGYVILTEEEFKMKARQAGFRGDF